MPIGTRGFLLILLVGLVILTIAALADRRSRLRREAALRPPTADLDADDHPNPDRVSAGVIQAAATLGRLDATQRSELDAQLADPGTARLDLQLLAPALANFESGYSILDQARVLVCAAPISDVREVLMPLQRAAGRYPLVIAASGFDEETEQTLIANNLAGKVTLSALIGDPDALAHLAELTGTWPAPTTTLQADSVRDTDLGRAERVIATADQTHVVVSA